MKINMSVWITEILSYDDVIANERYVLPNINCIATMQSSLRNHLHANLTPCITPFIDRFFQTDNIYQNVPPGTVVDDVITHYKIQDFYLVSHKGVNYQILIINSE